MKKRLIEEMTINWGMNASAEYILLLIDLIKNLEKYSNEDTKETWRKYDLADNYDIQKDLTACLNQIVDYPDDGMGDITGQAFINTFGEKGQSAYKKVYGFEYKREY